MKIEIGRLLQEQYLVTELLVMLFFILCVGSTEKEYLSNIDTIVERSLTLDKLKAYYRDVEAAKLFIMNKVTYCQERVMVTSPVAHIFNVVS